MLGQWSCWMFTWRHQVCRFRSLVLQLFVSAEYPYFQNIPLKLATAGNLWPKIEEQTWNVDLWNNPWVMLAQPQRFAAIPSLLPNRTSSSRAIYPPPFHFSLVERIYFPTNPPLWCQQSWGLENIYRSHPRIILSRLLITLFLLHRIKNHQFVALS